MGGAPDRKVGGQTSSPVSPGIRAMIIFSNVDILIIFKIVDNYDDDDGGYKKMMI